MVNHMSDRPQDYGLLDATTDQDALRERIECACRDLRTAVRGARWREVLARWPVLHADVDDWRDATEEADVDGWLEANEAPKGEDQVMEGYVSTCAQLVRALTRAIQRLRPSDSEDERETLVRLWVAFKRALESGLAVQIDVYDKTAGNTPPEVSFWDAWSDGLCVQEEESEDDYDEEGLRAWSEDELDDPSRMMIDRIGKRRPDPQPIRDEATPGFLVATPEETYGSSSVWLDPELLRRRLDVVDIDTDENDLSPSIDSGAASTTKAFKGTYRGEPVTIKRLADPAKTIDNAVALTSVCKAHHRLAHPNLVPLVGLAWHRAIDLQVLTPLQGSDLRSVLDSSEAVSLTWGEFKCQVAIDVASALAYLHAQNLTAGLGGLTSYHIVLTHEQGRTTAQLDLFQLPCRGVAAAQDQVPSPLRWLAPEVVRRDVFTSAAADMYALGVVLTELDTTKRPFHDAVNPSGAPMEDMLIAMRAARGEQRPEVSHECPDTIAALVAKCLSQDPAQRPRAEEAVYELRAILKKL